VGGRIIEQELAKMPEGDHKTEVIRRLSAIRNDGERDLYF
jgi:hypothetical protein